MRLALCILAVAALLPVVAAQDASTYVHVAAQPDFQYRADENIMVPFQVLLVKGNVPSSEAVRVHVKDSRGKAFPVEGADYLAGGVKPYPAVNQLNLGHLDPGLYAILLAAEAGGARKEYRFDVSVVLPPVPYAASLEGKGDDAVFSFTPLRPDRNESFTIRVFRDGAGGRLVLSETTTWEAAKVPVPTVPGETVKVEVQGPNLWVNHGNKDTDWLTGTTTYPAWQWNPNYKQIENAQDASLLRVTGTVSIIALMAAFGVWIVRRS